MALRTSAAAQHRPPATAFPARGIRYVSLQTVGQALAAVRDWAFVHGPDICTGQNAPLFGTLLHRWRLVPRIIPAIGLMGAPFSLAASACGGRRP